MIEQEEYGKDSQADETAIEDIIAVADIGVDLEDADTSFTENPTPLCFRPYPHRLEMVCRGGVECASFRPVEKPFKTKTHVFMKDCTCIVKEDAGSDSNSDKNC